MIWIHLTIGSVAGGFARYGLSGLVQRLSGDGFPYGTMIVNLSGTLLIGFLNGLASEKLLLGPKERILLMTGFCGAFTTFSSWMLETSDLFKNGEVALGIANLGVSVVAGLGLFFLGEFIARSI
jgi:CrcB protein